MKRTLDHLVGDRGWARLEATIVVGRTAADLAQGEADLVAECERAEISVELMAVTDNLRVYRLGARS